MRGQTNLWILTIQTPPAHADAISELYAEDSVSLTILAPPRKNTALVEAIFDFEPNPTEMTARAAIYAGLTKIKLPAPVIRPAPNLDWLKKVAEDFPPIKIARWTVHGAMHRHQVPNRLFALQIDATNAFGTGEHPTTRGCLILLDELLRKNFRPRRMADIGCGSGILAMGCVQATRGRAVAVDLDPDSVQISQNNVRGNGLGQHIRVGRGRGYGSTLIRASAPYGLIMANIFANPLCQIAYDLKNNLRPGGYAILSGLLTTQANKVIAAHRMQGLTLCKHLRIGEWSVLALHRPNKAI